MKARCFLAAIATALLFGCAHRPLGVAGSTLHVKSVVGIHTGKCSPPRVAEIEAALQTLTARRLSGALACACTPESFSTIISGDRRFDANWPPGSRHENSIVVALRRPIVIRPSDLYLTNPRVRMHRASQIVAMWGIHGRATALWFDVLRDRQGRRLFSPIMTSGDPFDLENQEC